MRIAFFQRDLPSQKHGGVAGQVHSLANALCGLGHSVTVFTLSPRPADARYVVSPVAMPGTWLRARFARKFFLGYYFARINTNGFDAVHAHGDNFLLFGKHPQVRTYYGSALAEAFSSKSFGRFLSQLVLWAMEIAGSLAADKKTAISPGTRKYIPFIHDVVPCGIDLARYCPGGEKSAHPTLLFVGDLYGRKRGLWLLRKFEDIRKAQPDAELWMVTPEPVKAEGVRHFVALSENALIGLYRQAWILCSPSRYEGFGLPMLEAMACGTPVVASPNDGSRFLLENGRFGLLAADSGMVSALSSMLKDADNRKKLEEKGLERAREFDMDRVARRYVEIYHASSAAK